MKLLRCVSRPGAVSVVCSVALVLGLASSASAGAQTPPRGAAGGDVRTIMVTNADNGRTYRLPVGDRLVVTLSGPASFTWTTPRATNSAVLKQTQGAPGTTATATFVASTRGWSRVSAFGVPPCTTVCLPLVALFQIAVKVVR